MYNYGGLPIIGRVGVVAENLTNPENTQVIDFMYHKVGDEYVEGDTLPSFYGYSAFTDSLNGGFYPGEYRLYMASRDYRDTEWQPMRIVNVGPIYYNMTVAALNEGSEEAMEDAFYIKLQALASGDDELIEKIDYLWNVI